MSGFKMMSMFYGVLAVVPAMLWLIAVLAPFQQLHELRVVLLALVGIGSIIFGVIGFNEVFVHGK